MEIYLAIFYFVVLFNLGPFLEAECHSRVKRQFSFGIDPGILGGFLGFNPNGPRPNPNQPRPQNHGNHGNAQPLNPIEGGINLFNQFLGGGHHHQNQRACHQNNGGCAHICQMRRNRAQCFCHDGFVLGQDGITCVDIDECASRRPCQHACANSEGSFKCQCPRGSVLLEDGWSCGQTQRSCAVDNGRCTQVCVHNGPSVVCQCNGGYELDFDERSCYDIDECASSLHSCASADVCVNTNGAYECAGADGRQSCRVDNGGCEHECRQNRKGVIKCLCQSGFELRADGKRCATASNSCAIANGGCEQRCRDTRQGTKCACRRRFQLQADGKSCSRRGAANGAGGHQGSGGQGGAKSCGVNNGGCSHRCRQNRRRGVWCKCRRGFVLQSDGHTCSSESDPCHANGGCDHTCVNNGGVAECKCRQGFAPVGGLCKAVVVFPPKDPCATDNGGCEQICTSLSLGGQVECSCNVGYTFTHGLCQLPVPSDPCLVHNGGCEQICTNANGQAKCSCIAGFVSKNGLCQVADPCSIANGGCGVDHVCKATKEGQVECKCKAGFVLAAGKCQHVIVPPGPTKPTTIAPTIQDRGCGKNTKKSLFRRIVGGIPAHPKDWPWMAALLRKRGATQFCGGTLISDRHVLTAAHCVNGMSKENINVRLGEYDFKRADENNPTDFTIADIRMHSGYDTKTQENDIAILKLSRASAFSEFIWPVCLPPLDNNFEDQLGYVTGWGTIGFGGTTSSVLQEVVIPVWRQADCVAAYPDNLVAASMLCAGQKSGGKDSCQGDSGGPFLVQIFPDIRWHVVGVVSWGIGCADENRPGVYTRVNVYLDWIKQNAIF